MISAGKQMEHIFASIPAVLSGLGTDDAATEAVTLATWRQVAGEMLDARTEPLAFRENRLVIGVLDGAWKRHLEDLAPGIIARLNSKLGHGTVKFIEFK